MLHSFSCVSVYIGNTGRCFNDGLREHNAALGAAPSEHLAVHVKECLLTAFFTSVLFRSQTIGPENFNKSEKSLLSAMSRCLRRSVLDARHKRTKS